MLTKALLSWPSADEGLVHIDAGPYQSSRKRQIQGTISSALAASSASGTRAREGGILYECSLGPGAMIELSLNVGVQFGLFAPRRK